MSKEEKQMKQQVLKNVAGVMAKTKNPKSKKYILAGSLALVAVSGIGYGAYKLATVEKPETTIEDEMLEFDETQDVALDVKNMSFEQLLANLNEGNQKETFEAIDEFQNYFNNTVAPSIKNEEDEDAQLYITGEEAIAFYIMANSDTYTLETLYDIFGNAETINSSRIADNYLQVARVMYAYYSRAQEESGISKLYKSESNQKLVDAFEKLVIAYNKAENANTKIEVTNQILEMFGELTDDTKIDTAKDTNAEAVSYILTVGVNWAQANQMFQSDNNFRDRLITENENVTCDTLYKEVKHLGSYAIVKGDTDKAYIVKEMPRALDEKNVKAENRNIAISFVNGHKANGNLYDDATTVFESTTAPTEITREQAVEMFGEEKVKEAETKAEEKVEQENKVKEQEDKDYANGYNAGYEAAYISAADSGVKISTSTGGSAKYQEGYSNGVNNGYNDGMVEYNDRQSGNTVIDTTVTERPLTPEEEKTSTATPAPTQPETPQQPVQPEPTPVTPSNSDTTTNEPVVTEKPMIPQEEPLEEGEFRVDEFGNPLQAARITRVRVK